jgi:hypothetical protein
VADQRAQSGLGDDDVVADRRFDESGHAAPPIDEVNCGR